MTAGERVFVDFLPDSWTGPPPSLPLEVIRELSERARAAERALRLQRAAAEAKKRPPIRVRASVQPTFVRFVFEMPDGVGVSSVLNDQKLTLHVQRRCSPSIWPTPRKRRRRTSPRSTRRPMANGTAVEITLIGDVDVHSFREEKNYIVDVAFQQAEKPSAPVPSAADAVACTGVSAGDGAVPAARKPAAAGSRAQAAEIAPPTSESDRPKRNIRDQPEPRRQRCRRQSEAAKAHPAAPERGAEPAPKRRQRRKPQKTRRRPEPLRRRASD